VDVEQYILQLEVAMDHLAAAAAAAAAGSMHKLEAAVEVCLHGML
jgi:hypothetical protein